MFFDNLSLTTKMTQKVVVSDRFPCIKPRNDWISQNYKIISYFPMQISPRKLGQQQGVKILFNPILSYFLAKSYFVLYFGHFAFNFGTL